MITALLVALASYGVYSYVIQMIDQNYSASLKTETDSFELALQHSLIVQDQVLVENLIKDLSQQSFVETIRLLDSNGKVVASSIPEENGILLNMMGRNCSNCHGGGNEPLPLMRKVPSEDEDKQHIVIANPLNNRLVCQSCHLQEQETLGLILAEYHGTSLELLQRNAAFLITLGGGSVWLALFLAIGFFPKQIY